MKLKEYALLAEIISATVIVASLIFVGIEIRANTKIARTDAYQAVMSELINHREGVFAIPGMSELLVQVGTPERIEQLSEAEINEIINYYANRMNIYELAFVANQNDVFSEQEWIRWPTQICSLYEQANLPIEFSDGVTTNFWTEDFRSLLIPDFVDFIENTC